MNILHQDADKNTVELVTRWVFGWWLVIILIDPFTDLSVYPYETFRSIGPVNQLITAVIGANILHPAFLFGLKITAAVALCVVLIKRNSRLAICASALLLTVHQGLIRGIVGWTNHSEMLLLYAAYILMVYRLVEYSPKRSNDTDKPGVNPYGIPLFMIVVVLCLTYCFVGAHRVAVGGWEIYFSGTIDHNIVENSNKARIFSWHWDHLIFEYPWLRAMLNAGFPMSTLFEVLAPLCLISRSFRYAFVAFMVGFHFLTWFFVGILFWHTLLLYPLFFDLSKWLVPITYKPPILPAK